MKILTPNGFIIETNNPNEVLTIINNTKNSIIKKVENQYPKKPKKPKKQSIPHRWNKDEIIYLMNNLNQRPAYLIKAEELQRHTRLSISAQKSRLSSYKNKNDDSQLSDRVKKILAKIQKLL